MIAAVRKVPVAVPIGVGLAVLMACLPLLNISIPGVLPTPTYQPGTLALLSLAMIFAALALTYNMLLGTSGMLSFGHALYFGAGAYGLGIVLENLGVPLFPGVFLALIGGLVIALITGAVFLMSFQDAVVKLASAGLPLWQLNVLRGGLALAVLWGLAAWEGEARALWRGALRPWNLLRGLLLALMYLFLYAAVPVLSLPAIGAAFYTGPLFITLLSAALIGEPVGRRGWIAVAIGFAGVLVMLRPGSDAFSPAILLPVLGGLSYALSAITTRSRCQEDTPQALAASVNIMLLTTGGLAIGGLALWQPDAARIAAYPFLLEPWAAMAAADWGMIAVLAGLLVLIGVGLAGAYRDAPPNVVATFDYSYLLFAALWSFALFGETPDGPTLAGMALIVLGGGLAARRKADGRK